MKTNYAFLKNFSLMILALLAVASCNNKNGGGTPGPEKEKTMKDLVVAANFEWKTSKPANLKITAEDNGGVPIAGAKFSIYNDDPENGGRLIVSGVTNVSGVYSVDYSVPAYYSALYVRSDYVGLPTPGMVSLENTGFDITLGGRQKNAAFKMRKNTMVTDSHFKFLGSYNSEGVPDYLEPHNDPINRDFLRDINN